MKLIFNLIAEKIIRDQLTNNASAINIIEQFNSDTFPLFFSALNGIFLVTKEEGDPEDIEVKIVLELDGVQLYENNLSFGFLGKKRARVMYVVNNLVIPKPGTLTSKIFVQDDEIGEYNMDINQITKVEKMETPIETDQES